MPDQTTAASAAARATPPHPDAVKRPKRQYHRLPTSFADGVDVYKTWQPDGESTRPMAKYRTTREHSRALADVIEDIKTRGERAMAPLAIVPRDDSVPYIGMIDFDAVMTTPFDMTTLHPTARAILDIVGDTYTEFSASGTGLHAYVDCTFAHDWRHDVKHTLDGDAKPKACMIELKARSSMPLYVTAWPVPHTTRVLASVDDDVLARIIDVLPDWRIEHDQKMAITAPLPDHAAPTASAYRFAGLPVVDQRRAVAWANGLLRGALAELRATPSGNRADALSSTAHRLGKHIGDYMTEQSVIEGLFDACSTWPSQKKIADTIRRRVDAGKQKPADWRKLETDGVLRRKLSLAELYEHDADVPLPDTAPQRQRRDYDDVIPHSTNGQHAPPSRAASAYDTAPDDAAPYQHAPPPDDDVPPPDDAAIAAPERQRADALVLEHYIGFVGDLRAVEPVRWLARPFVYENGCTLLYGPTGSGKSQMAISICGTVIEHGRSALYIATENVASARTRVAGFLAQHPGQRAAFDDDRLFMFWRHDAIPDLLNPRSMQILCSVLDRLPELSLVVIDTLRNAFSGEETPDMYAAITRAVTTLRNTRNRPAVMLVGHTGKNEALGFRGSTSLPAYADVTMRMTPPRDNEETVKLSWEKTRDSAIPVTRQYFMRVVKLPAEWLQELPPDADVSERTAPVLVPASARDDDQPDIRRERGAAEARVLFVLRRRRQTAPTSYVPTKVLVTETGLPLATVKAIVERLPSYVSVQRAPGKADKPGAVKGARLTVAGVTHADAVLAKAKKHWLDGVAGAPPRDTPPPDDDDDAESF
jgi:hypothetical protein